MQLGLFGERAGDRGMGRLAKASGATEAQVRAWMAGEVAPTTQQALAVLAELPARAAR